MDNNSSDDTISDEQAAKDWAYKKGYNRDSDDSSNSHPSDDGSTNESSSYSTEHASSDS